MRKGEVPGLVLAVTVGVIAWGIAGIHQAIDALVAGIVLGMVIRTFIGEKPYFLPGLKLAPKLFIPMGIIIYGVNLQFHKLTVVPAIFWLQLLVGTIVVFTVALYLGRKLDVRDKTALLIATGTAICGASAIAIATPVVKADSEDAGASLITITVLGLFGMLIYPLAITFFSLSKTDYALLCASTLHQTGLVKTAAFALGESCLKLALSIKMARTAMVIPVVGFLCWYTERKERPILFQLPWFMWAFVLVGLLTSFIPGLGPLARVLKPWATISWTLALTSIGLTVDLKEILNAGGGPLVVGLACWLAAIGVFILGNCIF